VSLETYQRIMEAAREVFARYGFEAPLQLVAKKAGVAKSLVVWYFGSKWDLVRKVALESLPADVAQACTSRGLRGEELVSCLIDGFMRKYSDEVTRRLYIEAMALSNRDEEVGREISRFCESVVGELASAIYGSDTPENRVRVRIIFGALMCYALNKPRFATPELYADVLKRVAKCPI